MNVGELKGWIEEKGLTDDFDIDIYGEQSGSFGDIVGLFAEAKNTPNGMYKELQIKINA